MTRGLIALVLAAVLVSASCSDGDGTAVSAADGTSTGVVTTTTPAFSEEEMNRMTAACEAAATEIEAPHQWAATLPGTVGDTGHDFVPPEAIAAWKDVDPGTPVAHCVFELHECEDPRAISAFQHIFITDSTRVDFGESEITDCDADARPGPAVWGIDPSNPPDPALTSFTALVRRMQCSGGVTGAVLEPVIEAGTEEVVVTFSVEPIPRGSYLCGGNPGVPAVVELDSPIGDRRLVDGACTDPDVESTIYCEPSGTRWPADPAGFPEDRARLGSP